MSLETLLLELKKIYDVHPNSSVVVTMESPELGDSDFDPNAVRYDNLSKTTVIEV